MPYSPLNKNSSSAQKIPEAKEKKKKKNYKNRTQLNDKNASGKKSGVKPTEKKVKVNPSDKKAPEKNVAVSIQFFSFKFNIFFIIFKVWYQKI